MVAELAAPVPTAGCPEVAATTVESVAGFPSLPAPSALLLDSSLAVVTTSLTTIRRESLPFWRTVNIHCV